VKTGSIKRNKVSESSLSAKPRSALASVAQARAAMLSGLALCDAETVALASTLGRVLAGAALPEGADAVVIQENVARAHDKVTVPPARAGQHVRPRAMSGGERLGRCDGSGL
jgi:molybdopterin biosynthesis enzyme